MVLVDFAQVLSSTTQSLHTTSNGLNMYGKMWEADYPAVTLLAILGSVGMAKSTGDRHRTDLQNQGSRGRYHFHRAAHDTITFDQSVLRLSTAGSRTASGHQRGSPHMQGLLVSCLQTMHFTPICTTASNSGKLQNHDSEHTEKCNLALLYTLIGDLVIGICMRYCQRYLNPSSVSNETRRKAILRPVLFEAEGVLRDPWQWLRDLH